MRPLLCALVILLLLCACSSNESGVKQVEYGGKTFVVDTEAGTITLTIRCTAMKGAESRRSSPTRTVPPFGGGSRGIWDMVDGVLTMIRGPMAIFQGIPYWRCCGSWSLPQ